MWIDLMIYSWLLMLWERVLVCSDWSPTHDSLVYGNRCAPPCSYFKRLLSPLPLLNLPAHFHHDLLILLEFPHLFMSFSHTLTLTLPGTSALSHTQARLKAAGKASFLMVFFFESRFLTWWLLKNQNHQILQYDWLSPSLTAHSTGGREQISVVSRPAWFT